MKYELKCSRYIMSSRDNYLEESVGIRLRTLIDRQQSEITLLC